MIKWDTDGNGEMYQGDTGYIDLEDLDSDRDYTIYLAIQNKSRKIMGSEQYVIATGLTKARIYIPTSLSKLLTVPLKESFEDYYYFLKACKKGVNGEPDEEDTLFVNDATFGDLKRIRVYPLGAEGVVNG